MKAFADSLPVAAGVGLNALTSGEDLRESRLHERAAVLLAADAVAGRLEPGDPFPSGEEIVERFGFSRTVAREAVQTLSMLGVIRVQHGKRTEVRPAEDWNVLSPLLQEALRREGRLEPVWNDLYEFRLLIEPAAAAWMALRGLDADKARLTALAAEMRVLSEDPANRRRVLAADQAFHKLIALGAKNRVLTSVSRSFWEAVSVIWLESQLDAAQLHDVAHQHQRIADAIIAKDPVQATAAMEDHLARASTVDTGQFVGRP